MNGVTDWASIAEALARPGMDPREWLCWGTVATMDDEGKAHYDDPHAVHQGPEGVEVDVYLETLDKLVTCHYPGIQGGGRVYVGAPIGPGDRVVVGMPEGDTGGCVILAIGNGASDPVPLGDDKKPIFQNDRLLVWAKSVPIDIRTAGGAEIFLEQDGSVHLGTRGATQSVVFGDARNSAETQELAAISAALDTLIAASSDAYPTLVPGFTALKTAVELFKTQLPNFLSPKVKTS